MGAVGQEGSTCTIAPVAGQSVPLAPWLASWLSVRMEEYKRTGANAENKSRPEA